MSVDLENRGLSGNSSVKMQKGIYQLGAIAALVMAAGSLADIFISMALGGDLTLIPKNAPDRFVQLQNNALLGLYYLDLLNVITSILVIPVVFALCWAHRQVLPAYSGLVMILSIIGTAIFVSGNVALPMLELSHKYAVTASETYRIAIVAAGEALLARGEHGGLGVFIGFVIPTIGNILLSGIMVKGKIFRSYIAWFGLIGNSLLLFYLVLVTFIPGVKSVATVIAAPGGIMTITWLVLSAVKLFQCSKAMPDA